MAIDLSKFDTTYRIAPIYRDEKAEREWSNAPSDGVYGDERRAGYKTEADAQAAADRLSADLACFEGEILGFEVIED